MKEALYTYIYIYIFHNSIYSFRVQLYLENFYGPISWCRIAVERMRLTKEVCNHQSRCEEKQYVRLKGLVITPTWRNYDLEDKMSNCDLTETQRERCSFHFSEISKEDTKSRIYMIREKLQRNWNWGENCER